MPQIAQQDYIVIEVSAFAGTLAEEDRLAIKKHIANWPDIILINKATGERTRIITYIPQFNTATNVIMFYGLIKNNMQAIITSLDA